MANEDGIKVDFRADGLLWLINRTAFHPRGFALGYDDDTGEFVLIGDGTEPWHFELGGLEDDLFAKVESLFERTRTAA